MAYVTSAERIGIKKGIEQGIERGIEKGIKQGIQKGEQQILLQLIQYKFGNLSDYYSRKINAADSEQVQHWAKRIFDAKSLTELFVED